jgi:Rieske Fe-S protein
MIKKILISLLLMILICCTGENYPENCIRPASFSITKNATNPEFNQILTINGTAEILGGYKGILIINVGLNEYMAFDKICPNNDCNSPMTFDKTKLPVLKCECDGSEYGISKGIGGAPQTDGFFCFAIEYRVTKNGDAIRISNF